MTGFWNLYNFHWLITFIPPQSTAVVKTPKGMMEKETEEKHRVYQTFF